MADKATLNRRIELLDADNATLNRRIELLEEEKAVLNRRIKMLEEEIEFLRLHPVFAQGLKGETIAVEVSDGIRTQVFASAHDVVTGTAKKIEVKFSKLNCPNKGTTRRWNWSKPLGWKDKGKDFNFLLLVGEKDQRYLEQYPPGPYVFFLIPRDKVESIKTEGRAIGANVQLTTNFLRVRSETSRAIIECMVPGSKISALLNDSRTDPTDISATPDDHGHEG